MMNSKRFDYPENVNWINQIMKEIKQAFFAKRHRRVEQDPSVLF
jgi:hypothetical protein